MKNKQGLLFWGTSVLLLPLFIGLVLAYPTLTSAAGIYANGYHPPKHIGGTITYGGLQFPPSTNPWFDITTAGISVQDALWGAPVVANSKGEYLPDQLVEVPTQQNGDVSNDGLTVTMKLRPDLTWSDGQPLTADDFVYWEQTAIDPNTGANSYGYDQIASIVATNAHTVTLTYQHPFGPYLQYLPLAAPKHVWSSIANQLLAGTQDVNLTPQVTSGPFMISSYTLGQSFTMVPNPHYTSGTFHQSVLNQLIFKAYSTATDLIAAYQSGQIQHAEGFRPANLTQLDGIAGLHLASDIGFEFLGFNLANPVLQDLNVRKAITQAINRCQLIEQAIHEPCKTLQVQGILPRPSPAFDAAIKFPDFSLSQARQDMKAAGWDCSTNPCTRNNQPFPTLTLVTTNNNLVRTSTAQLIQQALATLGIPVTLQFYSAVNLFGGYTSNGILATGQFDLSIYAEVFNFDPNDLFAIVQSNQIPSALNPGGGNFGQINDSQLDTLFDQGRATLDQDERLTIYKQAEERIADQLYFVPLYLYLNSTLTSAQIVNYTDNIVAVGNEWNVGDWWLKS